MPAAGALIEMPAERGVRHRAMASSTLTCCQVSHWRLRSMNAAPAARMRSATSSSFRLSSPCHPGRESPSACCRCR